MMEPWQLGIDLGGTKIEAILLSHTGEVIWQRRVSTPQGQYGATVATMAALVKEGVGHARGSISHVGIGIPGAVSAMTGRIKNANSTCLIGQDLAADVEAQIGMPVRLANDANCFALSEASDGTAANAASVFGVILGTGCGGGLVINGQVVTGANAIAGEWGHNPMPWLTQADQVDAGPCYCAQAHCIETYLSGPGFSRWASARMNQSVTPPLLVELADGGDEQAAFCLELYADRLARALACVINVLDPDSIVLGGGLSQMAFLYQRVPELWDRYVFSDQVVTRLRPPKWGDASGVRGAAWL
ncbi:ROK family protein [Thiomicrospira sp. WB1]|uniref:ROK family protein n=1 Tax=Thiomicrospira sp. WB1 TaxID=1685380 RepID=UPI000748FBC3|nr:ROK family protein [Thiomicrospira sp. WB1]KUJ72934.1 transcriptional regulator [Thiomicrospira sp. WB1]